MKIERVDENTIKCFISTEEMEQYQVEYTDFLSRTDKAQELMKTIIRQAHEEVGYVPPKFAFEMQIMMVPDQGMVLTFTEKEPFDMEDKSKVDAFISSLKDFVNKLSKHKDELDKVKKAIPVMPTPKKNGTPDPNKVEEAVFAFATLSQVMDFADILPGNLRIASSLYKMGDSYYLHIKQATASYDRYSRICIRALEFGDLYRADFGCDEILKEHGECLIAEKALKKLRGKA
ncbi:MAG: adaptor protein MecA [Lachnospiraceae bacterium]|nr:adaptor protein MecA [Lachnospiraceae bacterium]